LRFTLAVVSGQPPGDGDLSREDGLPRDIEIGISPRQPIRRFLRRSREWVEQYPRLRWAYRLGVAVLGTLIVIIGLLLVPLPGPGWLIVFLGLATLGTEFPAAARLGAYVRRVLTRLWHRWRDRKATGSA
jgi:uncharacterized protein (TIGR02611 family)